MGLPDGRTENTTIIYPNDNNGGQVIDEWVVVVVPASPQIGQYEGGQRRAGGVDCCGGSRSKVVRAVTSYERSVPDKEEGEVTN